MELEVQSSGKQTISMVQAEKAIRDDRMIKDLDIQINKLKQEQAEHLKNLESQLKQVDQLEKDLTGIKNQLIEIQQKETDLIGKREDIENQIRKLSKLKNKEDQIEVYTKDIKRIKELLSANDNIKA